MTGMTNNTIFQSLWISPGKLTIFVIVIRVVKMDLNLGVNLINYGFSAYQV